MNDLRAHNGHPHAHVHLRAAILLSGALAAGCTAQGSGLASGSSPFVAPDLPVITGQAATCAGPREKSFTLEAREVTIDLGMGQRFSAWTYDGKLPGPVL